MPLTSLNVPVNINPKTTNCIISLDSMLLDVAINVYPLNSFNLLISGGFFSEDSMAKTSKFVRNEYKTYSFFINKKGNNTISKASDCFGEISIVAIRKINKFINKYNVDVLF